MKPDNKVIFTSASYDNVVLVRKSIGYHKDVRLPNGRIITYWNGQLAEPLTAPVEKWPFHAPVIWCRGKVVWLDALEFKLISRPLGWHNEFPKEWTEHNIKNHFVSQGYFNVKFIPGRGWCGLLYMAFTLGLCYNMGFDSYYGRYCFDNYTAAVHALAKWNGLSDPPGLWIKHKGGIGEYSHPRFKNGK